MKKIIYILLLTTLLSCHKEPLPIPYGNISIKVDFKEAYQGFSKENIEITITEQDDTLLETRTTDANGVANFANIINDVYKVKIKHTYKANIVESLIGIPKELTFYGESNNLLVTANETREQTIQLNTNNVGNFVIKEVYHSNAGGGSQAGGFYQYIRFNDSFFEIYNNSPETLYADGLQIGVTSNVYENLWRTDTKHMYLEQIFTIKGSGQQYPVLPGESIVIAATAINHINPEGLSQEQVNGLYLFGTVEQSADLSIANFETYFDGFATNYDIDVANIPNLEVSFNSFATLKEIVTTNRGISLVLFKDTDINSLETVSVERGNTPTIYNYKKLPTTNIEDAFESQDTKCFPNSVIGEHLITPQAWQGKSYRRKTATIINGRRVLLDTDNCVNDFETLEKSTPGTF